MTRIRIEMDEQEAKEFAFFELGNMHHSFVLSRIVCETIRDVFDENINVNESIREGIKVERIEEC